MLVKDVQADLPSLLKMKSQLQHFAAASGLEANLSKSMIYLGGVHAVQRQILSEAIGMELGVFPVKYLGVPLTPQKLHIHHYRPLIDKMTA